MVPIHFSQVILLSGVLVSHGVLGGSVLKSRDLLDHLLTRQHDSPSDMCETNCENITSTLSKCNDQTCACTISNAQMLESCVDCVVALNATTDAVAKGQATLDEFNSACQGTSIPSLTVDPSSSGATGSLEPVSASIPSDLGLSGLPFATTPTSPVTQPAATMTTITSMSGSAGFTPLHNAPDLVVVGVVAGIVLSLV